MDCSAKKIMAEKTLTGGLLGLFFIALLVSCANRSGSNSKDSETRWTKAKSLSTAVLLKNNSLDAAKRVLLIAPSDTDLKIDSLFTYFAHFEYQTDTCTNYPANICSQVNWNGPEFDRLVFDRVVMENALNLPGKRAKFLSRIRSRMRLGGKLLLIEEINSFKKHGSMAVMQSVLALSGYLTVSVDSTSFPGNYLIFAK